MNHFCDLCELLRNPSLINAMKKKPITTTCTPGLFIAMIASAGFFCWPLVRTVSEVHHQDFLTFLFQCSMETIRCCVGDCSVLPTDRKFLCCLEFSASPFHWCPLQCGLIFCTNGITSVCILFLQEVPINHRDSFWSCDVGCWNETQSLT